MPPKPQRDKKRNNVRVLRKMSLISLTMTRIRKATTLEIRPSQKKKLLF